MILRHAFLICLALPGPAWAQVDPPTQATLAVNRSAAAALPAEDRRDFEFAERGYLGTRADPVIRAADGHVVVDLDALDFLKGPPPATVNPSLWRQSQLTARHGLFRVAERVYQVRGFDTANITFVRGKTGWLVIDTLTNKETAQAAYELVTEKLGRRPILAIIYTHSHGDHFGGAEGLKPFLARNAPIIAPVGFMKAAISESVIAGPTMARRAAYPFGMPLPQSAEGNVGLGIGPLIPRGTRGLLPPTREVSRDGSELTLDGVRMRFQLTLGTEAPAEMNIYFPDWKILDLAENANATQHNILTPRGALIRNAKAWADGLTDSLRRFDGADILITSHGWPRFGAREIATYIALHRDLYEFLHDQTVRLMNKGMTGDEIAARLKLPDALERQWYDRPYYGSLSFNSRAIYQYYMGWYDANPVHLAPISPQEAGRRYVDALGGTTRVQELAQAAYDKGEYPWAAELLNRLVFSGGGQGAKDLLARVYQQMAWQSENSLARNMYLTAALELRRGPSSPSRPGDGGFIAVVPTSDVFDMLATRIDPDRAGEARLKIRFRFADRNETTIVTVANGVMTHQPGSPAEHVDADVTGKRPDILSALTASHPPDATQIKIVGDQSAISRLAGWLDPPDPRFAIVTP